MTPRAAARSALLKRARAGFAPESIDLWVIRARDGETVDVRTLADLLDAKGLTIDDVIAMVGDRANRNDRGWVGYLTGRGVAPIEGKARRLAGAIGSTFETVDALAIQSYAEANALRASRKRCGDKPALRTRNRVKSQPGAPQWPS